MNNAGKDKTVKSVRDNAILGGPVPVDVSFVGPVPVVGQYLSADAARDLVADHRKAKQVEHNASVEIELRLILENVAEAAIVGTHMITHPFNAEIGPSIRKKLEDELGYGFFTPDLQSDDGLWDCEINWY